ncbi:hypothetical protein CIRG_08202 [Coccidioides immitis RMSCC 2394]|uniref:COP9 signalosome complex subunit 3 N-terminal helical repeats domain-containing protein n=1 Tax=Coccidioides immitis RMSCC 2394 TaxID=404692 RepID=A0A0J6YIQ8_COCIT|nr:hypothetical protein CIRG_08202 [Coccidioides immitis RMSCC 2394]
MADVLSILLSFPPQPPKPEITSECEYNQKARALVSRLRQIPPKDLTGQTASKSPLDILEPAKQSLAYLFLLLAHYQEWRPTDKQALPDNIRPGGGIWCKTVAFLHTFDPVQVRYAGLEFNRIVEYVANAGEFSSQPCAVVKPIQQAILRLDPSCSTFTSTHTVFTRLCLLARCYLPAICILDRDVYHFPAAVDKVFLNRSQLLPSQQHPSSNSYITLSSGLPGSMNYKTPLEYFLYGAMIYIGLKRWGKARHFLDIVISTPTSSFASMIMVEAYKKWILVNLLEKGMVPAMPHTVNGSVAKAYKALAKPYSALALVFKIGPFLRLKAEVSAGIEIWRRDNNTGLVFQLLDSFCRFSVLKLERSFAALSLPDVARLSLSDGDGWPMELFVAELLATKRLDARLFQKSHPSTPTILRFGYNYHATRGANEAGLWDCLMEQKHRMDVLLRCVHGTDVKLELGREYIEGLRTSKWRKNGGDNEGGILMGENHSAVEFEEDIMADLR